MDINPVFYTYVHLRADDGRVFYVGKGKGRRAWHRDGRSQHWHRVAAKHGVRIEVAAHWPSEGDAFEHERLLIACFRDLGHPLTNKTAGGEGASGYKHDPAVRARVGRLVSAALTGRKRGPYSAAHRAAVSAALRGKPVPHAHTALNAPEAQARSAAARRGQKLSPEHRAAVTAALRKAAEARRGVPRTPEAKAAISAARRGGIEKRKERR